MDNLSQNNITPTIDIAPPDTGASDSSADIPSFTQIKENFSGWDLFLNRLRWIFGFGSGGPAAGNSQGATNIGTNMPGAGSSDPLDEENAQAIVDWVATGDIPEGGSSAKAPVDISSLMSNSAFGNSEALQAYYDMYQKTGNEAYLEKLLDNMYNLEAANTARSYEKMMSDTSFSRLVEDIERAGYNPWLALQSSIGTTSSGSGIMAGKSGVSATSQATSAQNNRNDVAANITSNIIRALIMVAIFALR